MTLRINTDAFLHWIDAYNVFGPHNGLDFVIKPLSSQERPWMGLWVSNAIALVSK